MSPKKASNSNFLFIQKFKKPCKPVSGPHCNNSNSTGKNHIRGYALMAGFGTPFLSSAVKQTKTYVEVTIKTLFDCEVLIALDLVVQPHFILMGITLALIENIHLL